MRLITHSFSWSHIPHLASMTPCSLSFPPASLLFSLSRLCRFLFFSPHLYRAVPQSSVLGPPFLRSLIWSYGFKHCLMLMILHFTSQACTSLFSRLTYPPACYTPLLGYVTVVSDVPHTWSPSQAFHSGDCPHLHQWRLHPSGFQRPKLSPAHCVPAILALALFLSTSGMFLPQGPILGCSRKIFACLTFSFLQLSTYISPAYWGLPSPLI